MNELNEVDKLPALKGEGNNLSLLSVSELLSTRQTSVAEDFGRAFAHTLVQAPLEGVAQLIDGEANGAARKAVHFMDGPEHAKFMSANWVAQQTGSALGAIAPVLVIHKGVSGVMGRNYSAKAALAMSENTMALTTRQAVGAGSLKAVEAGLTGAIYSGVFTPVSTEETNFWQARGRNATVGGVTFATLTGAQVGMKAVGERTVVGAPRLSGVLTSDIGSGVLAGIPAGLVSANAESLLSGKGIATVDKQVESVLTFSMMGGGMAWGKGKLAELSPRRHVSESTGQFKEAGLDVDGRPIAESNRGAVTKNFTNYSEADMGRARAQSLRDMAEIKALEPGKTVLEQFRDSGLSISQKYRVLSSMAEVREHFVNQRANGKIEYDQQGNWIHTQGEFGKVIEASRASKLSPAQMEDALLGSMFSDAVKHKGNLQTHHMDGALAADHVLSKHFGAGFNRGRLDGVVHAIREHQIGPPEFMANVFYGNKIRGALNFNLIPEQNADLNSLIKKMSDPLNAEKVRLKDGGTALKLTDGERALLKLAGPNEWYVPDTANPWNAASRALIDGDTIDNYNTAGGAGKIGSLGGPETQSFFKTRRMDTETLGADRTTNLGSARASQADAANLLTPGGKKLAEQGVAQTEAAIQGAKERTGRWLVEEKGVDPSKEAVPFFNADLVYPKRTPDAEKAWWSTHLKPESARAPQEQQAYVAGRFEGLTGAEQKSFLLAKDIREMVVSDLRASQRVDGKQPTDYKPATKAAAGK